MSTDHAMTAGIIPIRHVGLPGVVKLPRRYEQAALGDAQTARHRRVSVCSGPLVIGDGMSERLDDLMSAIMWVKQELILLRQHDILLKRQFYDIHHSIQSLQSKTSLSSSCSSTSLIGPSTPPYTSVTSLNNIMGSTNNLPKFIIEAAQTSTSSTPNSSPVLVGRQRKSSSGRRPVIFSDFFMNTLQVRPSYSAIVLNYTGDVDNDKADNDTDGDDTFDETFYRPRTSSMISSRDLAAVARKRGSKELI